jgi:phage I-like protein
MEIRDFLFAELAEGGKPVEVLRIGDFVDRNGKDVHVEAGDLDAFVANFHAGTAGQDVPVDVLHERAEAAGWVRKLWRDEDRLLASVDWNELGKKLVGDRIYRYLSATIDLARRMIKSISLVNFPAVKGLQPVELSEGVYSFQAAPGLLARVVTAVVEAFGGGAAPTAATEQAELIIRKEGNEIILYSADGSKVLGRFPFGADEEYKSEEAAREAAARREREIQYFKHRGAEGSEEQSLWVDIKLMEEVCPDCAERMRDLGISRVNVYELAMPPALARGLCDWIGPDPGVFTRCMGRSFGDFSPGDKKGFCAWLHKLCTGKWPAEAGELPIGVEFSSQEDTMNEQELKQMRAQIRKEIEAEMAEKEKDVAQLKEQVRKELEVELEERYKRRQALVEFAQQVTSGEAGLSSKPEEIVALLEALPGDQERQALMAVLKAKVADFSEHGSSRDGKGAKKQLPKEYADALDAKSLTLAELADPMFGDLGDLKEYDLSKWQGGGK